MTKIVINPKTGMMETVDHQNGNAFVKGKSDIEAQVSQTRKELRDMLAGNVQFHADELGPKKPNNDDLYDADGNYV